MTYLKEDGSLDVEHINNLPIEEYIRALEAMTIEEYRDYSSKISLLNEGKNQPIKVVTLEDSFDEGVDADELLNKLRNELRTNG